jgi:hypothetical protein
MSVHCILHFYITWIVNMTTMMHYFWKATKIGSNFITIVISKSYKYMKKDIPTLRKKKEF